jgi:hypothetical protein
MNFYRNTTTPASPPTAFALLRPGEDARLDPGASAAFEWEASVDSGTGDEATYELRFALTVDAPPESWRTIPGLTTSEATVVLGDLGLTPGEEFFWTVVARNDCREGPVPSWRRGLLIRTPLPTDLRFSIRGVDPSPTRGPSVVSFTVPRPGTVAITVHDLLGRRVRRLFRGDPGAGVHVVSWDGVGDDGRVAAAGVYLVRAEFGGHVSSHRFVRLR